MMVAARPSKLALDLTLIIGSLNAQLAITEAPCGGEVAGRSPVDRGKHGLKLSVASDGQGIPLHLIAARANNHDSPLPEPTLAGICDMIGPLPQSREDRPCMSSSVPNATQAERSASGVRLQRDPASGR
jgi:hypothetical protein